MLYAGQELQSTTAALTTTTTTAATAATTVATAIAIATIELPTPSRPSRPSRPFERRGEYPTEEDSANDVTDNSSETNTGIISSLLR